MARKSKHVWLRLWQEWRWEICAVVLLVLGIFLFVERLALRPMFLSWLGNLGQIISGMTGLAKAIFSPSNFVALTCLAIASTLVVRRLRYRLSAMPGLTERKCPRCDHHLQKRHRGTVGRLVSYIVPVKRYSCSSCGWRGWRVQKPSDRSFKR